MLQNVVIQVLATAQWHLVELVIKTLLLRFLLFIFVFALLCALRYTLSLWLILCFFHECWDLLFSLRSLSLDLLCLRYICGLEECPNVAASFISSLFLELKHGLLGAALRRYFVCQLSSKLAIRGWPVAFFILTLLPAGERIDTTSWSTSGRQILPSATLNLFLRRRCVVLAFLGEDCVQDRHFAWALSLPTVAVRLVFSRWESCSCGGSFRLRILLLEGRRGFEGTRLVGKLRRGSLVF